MFLSETGCMYCNRFSSNNLAKIMCGAHGVFELLLQVSFSSGNDRCAPDDFLDKEILTVSSFLVSVN